MDRSASNPKVAGKMFLHPLFFSFFSCHFSAVNFSWVNNCFNQPINFFCTAVNHIQTFELPSVSNIGQEKLPVGKNLEQIKTPEGALLSVWQKGLIELQVEQQKILGCRNRHITELKKKTNVKFDF